MKKTIVILAATACAFSATVQATVTGWDNGKGGGKVLYVGTTENASDTNVVRTGLGEVSLDDKGNTVIESVTVSEYDSSLKQFRIAADKEDGQTAKIKTLTANDDSTITVDNSGWNTNKFANLTIDSLVANNAKIVVSEGQTLTLNGLSGSISNITVNGTLNLDSKVIGLNSFTLDADSMIGGTYNVGTNGIETLTITLSDADAITAALATGSYEKQLTSSMWNAEKIGSVVLNAEGYTNGGLLFQNKADGKYYSSAVWSNGGKTVTYSDEVLLNLDTAYAVAKVEGTAIKGLYAVVIPEPATATLSLLALAGLAARRRRK